MVLAVGGLWLCLMRGKCRLGGIPLVGAGFLSILAVTAPDVLVNRDGRLVAVNLGQGNVVMSPGSGNRFERDMWRRRFAVTDAPDWQRDGIGHSGRLGCNTSGCIVRLSGKTVSLVSRPEAVFEDCGRVDYVILLKRVPRNLCSGGDVVLSTFHVWRDGAHAVRFTDGGPAVETSRVARGDRPWSRLLPQKRQYLRTSPTKRP